MMFTCKICGNRISIPAADVPIFIRHKFECNQCYTVIASRRYETNIKGATTLFSPVSSALGDTIVEQVIKEQYVKDNPDELVISLNLCDADEAVKIHKPEKFFWASTTSFMDRPKKSSVINYSVAVEASEYARRGIYPTFIHGKSDVVDVGTDRFAVLSFRNIIKCTFKNAEPFLVNAAIIALQEYIDKGIIEKAILIGNDDLDENVYLPEWIIDKRKKLEIKQMASLCSRSKIFIGKDCGVAHLAAASGAMNMIVWGYFEPEWIIKAPPERFVAIMKKDSTALNIRGIIKERIKNVVDEKIVSPEKSLAG
jgi:hypothetical protein